MEDPPKNGMVYLIKGQNGDHVIKFDYKFWLWLIVIIVGWIGSVFAAYWGLKMDIQKVGAEIVNTNTILKNHVDQNKTDITNLQSKDTSFEQYLLNHKIQ